MPNDILKERITEGISIKKQTIFLFVCIIFERHISIQNLILSVVSLCYWLSIISYSVFYLHFFPLFTGTVSSAFKSNFAFAIIKNKSETVVTSPLSKPKFQKHYLPFSSPLLHLLLTPNPLHYGLPHSPTLQQNFICCSHSPSSTGVFESSSPWTSQKRLLHVPQQHIILLPPP